MKLSPAFVIWAVTSGLVIAGIALFFIKPHDQAIIAPGTITNKEVVINDQRLTQAFEPPAIIVLGNQASTAKFIHLVLGGAQRSDQRAYAIARNLQRNNDNIALNIIPAYDHKNIMYQAYQWALIAPKNSAQQAGYIDSLMAINGDINKQALSVVAQNSGIDVNDVDNEQMTLINKSLAQASSVLPPSLPALWINGSWLTGDAINEISANSHNTSTDEKLLVTNAYAYATPPNPKVASIFFTMRNIGVPNISIVSAQSPVAGKIELHNHFQDNNALMMRQVETIPVLAGEIVELEPSGLHLMLYDLPAPLVVGQTFPLTLTTQGGTEISTLVTVTPIGQALTSMGKIE